jgi:hypothetical protein
LKQIKADFPGGQPLFVFRLSENPHLNKVDIAVAKLNTPPDLNSPAMKAGFFKEMSPALYEFASCVFVHES